ncbi:glycosyltransferase family 2 protein [Stieleria sp. JC731]|nr:glycosyltransferase family 2 protein [Stieleria sp. JC731]MCC9599036.1 glycosyltransferase family 2 protein [Stieleria sp. JC731]
MIRSVRPSQLFIAADGPRADHASDVAQCELTRKVTENVDWDCQVRRLYRDENLGCQDGVYTAINWFFEHVDFGIILEDDCLADASFFPFCEELGKRYESDERIAVITGDNFQNNQRRGDCSYYFSKFNHCWGWATWRRAWTLYDHNLSCPTGKSDDDVIQSFATRPGETRYWKTIFQRCREGKITAWDYRWTFTVWKHRMLTITPQVNLVQNIGFGSDASNTTGSDSRVPKRHTMEFPLTHPNNVSQHEDADRFCARYWFGVGDPVHFVMGLLQGVAGFLRSIRRKTRGSQRG